MKKSKIVLLIGSLIVLGLSAKWYFTDNTSFEPTVAIGSALLTVLGYYFALTEEKKYKKKNDSIDIQGNNDIVFGGELYKAIISITEFSEKQHEDKSVDQHKEAVTENENSDIESNDAENSAIRIKGNDDIVFGGKIKNSNITINKQK